MSTEPTSGIWLMPFAPIDEITTSETEPSKKSFTSFVFTLSKPTTTPRTVNAVTIHVAATNPPMIAITTPTTTAYFPSLSMPFSFLDVKRIVTCPHQNSKILIIVNRKLLKYFYLQLI